MNSLKIVFMGSPEFALPSLETLHKSRHTILSIITQPDRPRGRGYRFSSTPVKLWAKTQGLYVYQPQRLTDMEFFKQLQVLSPDLIVNVAFGRIVPQKMLDLPSCGSINLHPSLLPAYRGAAPVQHAIFNGDEKTGATVLYMEEELDAGDIILQEEEPIYLSDTTGDLMKRLADKGAGLLLKATDLIASNQSSRFPQNPEKVTYAPVIKSSGEIVQWDDSSLQIHNKVRGLAPSPGAYTTYGGSRLKIWKTDLPGHIEEENKNIFPGAVVSRDAEGFRVKTGDGIIYIKEVQPEGKKRLNAGDFWRGYRLKEGAILGK